MENKENFFESLIDNSIKENEDIETIIYKLKEAGATQMETVKLVRNKLKISLKEADGYVLNSKAWEQNRQANTKLRDDFIDFLEKDK